MGRLDRAVAFAGIVSIAANIYDQYVTRKRNRTSDPERLANSKCPSCSAALYRLPEWVACEACEYRRKR